MSWTIWASMAVSAALVVATVWVLAARRGRPDERPLASVGETATTLIWTALLLVAAGMVWWAKLSNPATAGTDASSWYFVAVLGAVCVAGSCFTLLFALVKRVYATEEGIWATDAFGRVTRIAWGDVKGVTPNQLSKSVRVEAVDGTVVSVNGGTKAWRAFVEVAARKTPKSRGARQLAEIERRLTLGGRK